MKIDIPSPVFEIMQHIENNGYECYLVGGSVRDFLLKESPQKIKSEYDLASSGTPKQIKEIFSEFKILDYGAKHGTVIIHKDRTNYEITTYREEEDYSDGRRPDSVKFVTSIHSDLSRRDFTINALAADKYGEVLDLFSGLEDLKRKLIRSVGIPENRFNEDSLRLFRAIRFAVRLDFNIEKATYKALHDNVHLISEHAISGERILTELQEILLYFPLGLELLIDSGLLTILLDSQVNHSSNEYSEYIETISKVTELINKPNLLRNFALFFHVSTQEMTQKEAIRFIENFFVVYPGIGSTNISYISQLVSNYSVLDLIKGRNDIGLLLRVTREINWNLVNHKMIDFNKFIEDLFEYYMIINKIHLMESNDFNPIKFKSNFVLACSVINKKSQITGTDLHTLGFKGKEIGSLLKLTQLWFDQNQELNLEDLKHKIGQKQIRPLVDLSIIKKQYLDKKGFYIQSLDDLQMKEIILLENAFNHSSNSFAIIFGDSDLNFLLKLLPRMNKALTLIVTTPNLNISDLLESYELVENIYDISIDELRKKIIFVHFSQLKQIEWLYQN